jgi:hypothetical protein
MVAGATKARHWRLTAHVARVSQHRGGGRDISRHRDDRDRRSHAVAAYADLKPTRGLLTVLARVEDTNFNRWMEEARSRLPELLEDPAYRKRVQDGTFDRTASWLSLGNSYDWVGSLVKNKLIPEAAFMDVYSYRIIMAWELLSDIIPVMRRSGDDSLWDSFEYLYVKARKWESRNVRGTYPRTLERATLVDRWADVDRVH